MSRRNRFDVVLFDIDNVLVDTRASYLAAIQKTVEIYLNRPGVVTPKEIDQFKLLGGFNDDWDACYGIITFLETALHRLSISELRGTFPGRPLGIEGLLKGLKVLYGRVETPSYRKIAGIFQGIYLGSKKGSGLIRKEKLIFPKSLLEKIHGRGVRLGIVTGRDRYEAEYALKRLGILSLFDVLVTIDQVRREERRQGKRLRKPDPWPILEAARKFKKSYRYRTPSRTRLRFLYVGDLPDDVLAGKRAKKFISLRTAAFPKFTRDPRAVREELRKIKPDYLLKNPQGLLRLLS
ncbi:MAG: HAD hydrolase-like protein [Candidatus Omnitrophica bacterium]|nr:HAD hydrolase-like protein [Candidatus Omnitrophota bacterium]